MEKKYKLYPDTKFPAELIRKAIGEFKAVDGAPADKKPASSIFSIMCRDDGQFLSQYAQNIDSAELFIKLTDSSSLSLKYHGDHTEIVIRHPDQATMDRISMIFDTADC